MRVIGQRLISSGLVPLVLFTSTLTAAEEYRQSFDAAFFESHVILVVHVDTAEPIESGTRVTCLPLRSLWGTLPRDRISVVIDNAYVTTGLREDFPKAGEDVLIVLRHTREGLRLPKHAWSALLPNGMAWQRCGTNDASEATELRLTRFASCFAETDAIKRVSLLGVRMKKQGDPNSGVSQDNDCVNSDADCNSAIPGGAAQDDHCSQQAEDSSCNAGVPGPIGGNSKDEHCSANATDASCNKCHGTSNAVWGDKHCTATSGAEHVDTACGVFSTAGGATWPDAHCGAYNDAGYTFDEDSDCYKVPAVGDRDCGQVPEKGGSAMEDSDCGEPKGNDHHTDSRCNKTTGQGGAVWNDIDCGSKTGDGENVTEDQDCGNSSGSGTTPFYEDSDCGQQKAKDVIYVDADCGKPTGADPNGPVYEDNDCGQLDPSTGGVYPDSDCGKAKPPDKGVGPWDDGDCKKPKPGGGLYPDGPNE